MTDEDAAPTDEPTTVSDCPLCGQPVASVTIRGPTTAVVGPCGCRMPPDVLLVDPDADPVDAEDATPTQTIDADRSTERDPDPTDG